MNVCVRLSVCCSEEWDTCILFLPVEHTGQCLFGNFSPCLTAQVQL